MRGKLHLPRVSTLNKSFRENEISSDEGDLKGRVKYLFTRKGSGTREYGGRVLCCPEAQIRIRVRKGVSVWM